MIIKTQVSRKSEGRKMMHKNLYIEFEYYCLSIKSYK
jgi:hypothetical protein